MTSNIRTWIKISAFSAVSLGIVIVIAYFFLIYQINTLSNEVAARLKSDPELERIENIPIENIQNYSNEFNYAVEKITSEFPAPLQGIVQNYVDRKTYKALREEFQKQNFSTFSDIIPFISHTAGKYVRIGAIVSFTVIILAGVSIILALKLHERSEQKRKELDEKANSEGKVLL